MFLTTTQWFLTGCYCQVSIGSNGNSEIVVENEIQSSLTNEKGVDQHGQ